MFLKLKKIDKKYKVTIPVIVNSDFIICLTSYSSASGEVVDGAEIEIHTYGTIKVADSIDSIYERLGK